MIYLIAGVVLAAILGVATINIQHRNNVSLTAQRDAVKMQFDTAVAANKSLAESVDGVRKQCGIAQAALEKQHALDLKKQIAAKAALAKIGQVQTAKVGALQQIIDKPAGKDAAAQCRIAQNILSDLARERNP